MMLRTIALRVAFLVKHRTLKRLAVDASGRLVACGRTAVRAVPHHCPHQGAPLINGRVEGDEVVCHWHGCRYRLSDGMFLAAREDGREDACRRADHTG